MVGAVGPPAVPGSPGGVRRTGRGRHGAGRRGLSGPTGDWPDAGRSSAGLDRSTSPPARADLEGAKAGGAPPVEFRPRQP